MTLQTGAPLTASDVKLLRAGDRLKSITEEYHWRKDGAVCIVKDPPFLSENPEHVHYVALRPDGTEGLSSTGDPDTFAFVERPASQPNAGEHIGDVTEMILNGTATPARAAALSELAALDGETMDLPAAPVPMSMDCPKCDVQHLDEGEWAARPHKTHQCQSCGHEWRPFAYPTVGVARATPLPLGGQHGAPATGDYDDCLACDELSGNTGELNTPERDEVAGLSALAAFHRGTCITNSPFAYHRDRGCDCGLSAAIKACHFPPDRAHLTSRIAELEAERAKDREALKPFAEIAGRYLTGGLRSDLASRAPDLIKHLDALSFYAARARLSDPTGGRSDG